MQANLQPRLYAVSCNMTAHMYEERLGDLGAEVLKTFALRVARKCFLEHFCPPDHPVLSAEKDLVEVARSRMMEHLRMVFPGMKLSYVRPNVENIILQISRDRIAAHASDQDSRDSILGSVKEEISASFPTIH